MSSTQDSQDSPAGHSSETLPVPRWIPLALGVVLVMAGFSIYASHTTQISLQQKLDQANLRADLFSKQLEQTQARLADLNGKLDVTSEKLGLTQDELNRARNLAQSIRKEQQSSDEQLKLQLGQIQKESDSRLGEISKDVTGAKSDIEATRRELESTKSKLERTIGDQGVMSGLIARNREEVEELKRRGERNIFEFDIRKSNSLQRVGPIQMQLKKVDTRRFKYTLAVYADDKSIEKRDKTVNEPVQFYVSRALYELVVFEVSKDRAVGYLTTPKEIARR